MLRKFSAFTLFFFASPLLAMDGLELLKSMSSAMREKNYSGTFVYRHKDKVETLKIIHRYTDKGVNERLTTISGKPREIIRGDSVVTCIWPESKMVLVDKTHAGAGRGNRFPGIVPKYLDRLPAHYNIRVRNKTQRIADRASYVVDIKPKDQYRYGYRLWVDQASHLLTRSDLLDEKQQAVEQVLFTELVLHDVIADEVFKPKLLKQGYKWREVGEKSVVDQKQLGDWRAEKLPPGFMLQVHNRRFKNKMPQPIEHMIFSDGMASVSVFIEPHDGKNPAKNHVRRGALSVHGKQLNGHRIVVLGEVPAPTVQFIAESIKPTQ